MRLRFVPKFTIIALNTFIAHETPFLFFSVVLFQSNVCLSLWPHASFIVHRISDAVSNSHMLCSCLDALTNNFFGILSMVAVMLQGLIFNCHSNQMLQFFFGSVQYSVRTLTSQRSVASIIYYFCASSAVNIYAMPVWRPNTPNLVVLWQFFSSDWSIFCRYGSLAFTTKFSYLISWSS